MLVNDLEAIGSKLYAIRKQRGLTQAQVAEISGLSNNTYAEIERGIVNTSIESLLRICRALHITPDDILTEVTPPAPLDEKALLERLSSRPARDRETALQLVEIYLRSLSG